MAEVDVVLRQRIRAAVRRAIADARRSHRRQHREQLAATAQRKVLRERAVALIDAVDARARRTLAARLDHAATACRRPGEHRLDRAVAAVAHPAFEAVIERGRLRRRRESRRPARGRGSRHGGASRSSQFPDVSARVRRASAAAPSAASDRM